MAVDTYTTSTTAGVTMIDEGSNPANSTGSPPFNAVTRPSGTSTADTGFPSGMGSEGGAIGVISMMNLAEEFHPPMVRTSEEPPNEYLK